MDLTCQNSDFNVKYLLGQLNTARKEINNLRQQIKSLRYVHEKDVAGIKHLLESCTSDTTRSEPKVISSEEVKPSTSTDDDSLKLKPIGIISTWFPSKRGTPRQPGICGKVPGKLILYNSTFTNPDHALEGLQDFSHMWILFYFHRNDSTHIRAKVAPPRLNGTRTGVFSTRSPHRPCPIGLSLVKITKIENQTIYFEGVDMVDQSPVLDIKPYIPQYDSPLYFEKLSNSNTNSNSNRLQESNINDCTAFECIEEPAGLSTGGIRSLFLDTYHRKCSSEPSQDTDVSRDEEIALRLQAEEFQENPNFDTDNNTRTQLPDVSLQTNGGPHNVDIVDTHRALHVFQDISSDVRSMNVSGHTVLSNYESHSETVIDLTSRLENINMSHTGDLYTPRREANYVDLPHASRSRLLDGADGPSTVCGTDLDFIQRRLNSRIDNSPVRMGIREAPDGEEGLESQTLTPSQTLYNIQSAAPESTDSAPVSSETRVTERTEANEVRVPEWITRPRTPLSVVFNDRALIQLNEILGTKINDQKTAIENVLREDPRSVYLRQRWGSQFYTFLIHDLHITCRFDDNRGVVTVFQVRHAGRICECGEPEWQCLGHSPPN